MDGYTKDKRPFETFLNKFIEDLPKMNDDYRVFYTEIVEELYPKFKDIGTTSQQSHPPSQLTNEQVGLLGFIHYRFKFDKTPVDESTRVILKQAAEKLMVAHHE